MDAAWVASAPSWISKFTWHGVVWYGMGWGEIGYDRMMGWHGMRWDENGMGCGCVCHRPVVPASQRASHAYR
jgi:hypothetical protein